MKAKPQTRIFSFILNNEQTLNNIDHLKMNDYEKFKQLNKLGCRICQLAKDNAWQQLQSTFDLHSSLIPFLKLEIQNAFVSALNLRHFQTVKFFLQNGFNIEIVAEDAVLTVCYTLQYLRKDNTPIQLLQLLLTFGANPRAASSWGSQTAMHLAAQYNQPTFLELLHEYGGDIDAVNDDRQTPLGVAIRNKSLAAVDFLKSKGARVKWNQ